MCELGKWCAHPPCPTPPPAVLTARVCPALSPGLHAPSHSNGLPRCPTSAIYFSEPHSLVSRVQNAAESLGNFSQGLGNTPTFSLPGQPEWDRGLGRGHCRFQGRWNPPPGLQIVGTGFSVPSSKPSLAFPGGDSEREHWLTRELGLGYSTKWQVQPAFWPTVLPSSLSSQDNGNTQEGFLSTPASWGRWGSAIGSGPCHCRHTPWAWASPHPQGEQFHQLLSLQLQLLWEKPLTCWTCSSWRRDVIPNMTS